MWKKKILRRARKISQCVQSVPVRAAIEEFLGAIMSASTEHKNLRRRKKKNKVGKRREGRDIGIDGFQRDPVFVFSVPSFVISVSARVWVG